MQRHAAAFVQPILAAKAQRLAQHPGTFAHGGRALAAASPTALRP